MASSLGSLVVRLGLDAGDYTSGLAKAERDAQRFASTSEQSYRSASRAVDSHVSAITSMRRALTGLAGAFGVRELAQLSDEYQQASARLSIFTASQEQLASLQNRIFGIAQNTRQSLSGTVDLYYQLANATQDVGVSEKDLLKITDGINKALIISGATGGSAKGAIVQLSQALAAGKLRGQEFNTVNEQANRIMRALAEGLGKTVGELREMSNEGEITTDVFVTGFSRGLKSIDEEFAKIPVTISGALVVAQNEIQKFLGTTFQSSGQTTVFAKSILFIAKNIDVLAAAALGFGAVKLSEIILKNVVAADLFVTTTIKETAAIKAKQVATVEAVQAEVARLTATEATIVAARAQTLVDLQAIQTITAHTAASRARTSALIADLAMLGSAHAATSAQLTAAQVSLATAQSSTTASSRLLSRALAAVGGPIGAISLALGVGVTAWQLWSSSSEKAARDAAAAMETSTKDILANLNKQLTKLRERRGLLGDPDAAELARKGGEAVERAAELRAKAKALRGTGDRADAVIAIELEGQANDILNTLRNINTEQSILDAGNRKLKASAWMEQYATDTEKLNAEIKKAKDELGDFFTPELEKRIREKFTKKGPVDDPTKKTLDGQIRAIEASIAEEKDILRAREDFLRDTYQEGLLSVEKYYDDLQAARAKALRDSLAYYDQEAAAFQHQLDTTKREVDKEDARNKLADVRAKQANLQRDAANAEAALARERARATQDYLDQLTELNAKILEIKGNTAEAAMLRFDVQNRPLANRLQSSDALEGQAQLAIIRDQLNIQSKLNDVMKEYTIAVGYADLAQERLNLAQSTGAISELDYLYQTSDANKTRLAQLQKIADAYAQIAALSRDPADILKAEQIKMELEKVAAATDLVADKFNKIFADEFANAVVDVVTGAKSISDAFKSMAKNISKAIADIAAKNIATALFGKGGSASGAGGIFSQLFGPGGGDSLLKWILSLFGAGSAGGGVAGIGGFSGGGFGEHFAGGTAFAPGGMAWVGEGGPELVRLPRGSRVYPHDQSMAMSGRSMVFNVNVLPGADTRSARQAGGVLRDVVVRALKDR